MTMTLSRGTLALAGLLALVWGLAWAEGAFACSCAYEPAKKRLKRADAAAEIKVLKVRHDEPEGGLFGGGEIRDSVIKVKLLRVHKGPRRLRSAKTAKVYTGGPGNSCGLSPEPGWRSGLLLSKRGRNWSAHACSIIGRKELRRAADEKRGSKRSRAAQRNSCSKGRR